jgi:hypothetical protein
VGVCDCDGLSKGLALLKIPITPHVVPDDIVVQ